MLKMMEVKWASLFVCLLLVAHCSSESVKQTARYASLPASHPPLHSSIRLLYITPHYFSSLNVMIYHKYHTFIIRAYCCIRYLPPLTCRTFVFTLLFTILSFLLPTPYILSSFVYASHFPYHIFSNFKTFTHKCTITQFLLLSFFTKSLLNPY